MTDLTQFQIDLLTTIAGHGPSKGLELKEQLEDHHGVEINHGRLYPNLDILAERGLITKSSLNNRANQYDITARGERELEAIFQYFYDNFADQYEIDTSGDRLTLHDR